MDFEFYKYHGTGNDFILIDNRTHFFPKDNIEKIKFLCDRRFGIGADGLILLEDDANADFRMVYYNSDGSTNTMCGNGGRCIVAFAHFLGIIGTQTTFMAIDDLYTATLDNDRVGLHMKDVNRIIEKPKHVFLDTGSPHHVQLVPEVTRLDVKKEGAAIRYGLYGKPGSNINFVTPLDSDAFMVRTYERGVEDETLSCGTGVTAVALAMHHLKKTTNNNVSIKTPGGLLQVSYQKKDDTYTDVVLTGPAKQVFKGNISW